MIFVASRIALGCVLALLAGAACGGQATGSPAPSAACTSLEDQICAKWREVGGSGQPCNPPAVVAGVDFSTACEKAGEKCPYSAAAITCADAGP
jgi:hypothetical protein